MVARRPGRVWKRSGWSRAVCKAAVGDLVGIDAEVDRGGHGVVDECVVDGQQFPDSLFCRVRGYHRITCTPSRKQPPRAASRSPTAPSDRYPTDTNLARYH